MTTYEFYRDVCGGTADETSFAAAAVTAETVIRALLYPASAEDFSGERKDAFLRAVCMQADHGLAEERAGTGKIRSESLGDRSVTYADEKTGEIRVRGVSVSPKAVLLLENAGCLSRWV